MQSVPTVTAWLKAAGESTRLRLLALCAHRDFSVTDLAAALRQSEPRVSRHLRILCEAGLLERVRQGQWVHYRLADAAPAAGFVRGTLAAVDRRDPLLADDRRRAEASAVASVGAAAAPGASRLGRSLAAFVAATRASGAGDHAPRTDRSSRSLLVGVAHLELLEGLAAPGGAAVAVAASRRAAQVARALAAERGLSCRIESAPALRGLPEGPFDAIVLDRLDVAEGPTADVLAAARARLAPGGALWLFERYDALEESRDRVVQHPLARVRSLLLDAGFDCRRLNPIEADGELVLAAFAPLASVPAAGFDPQNADLRKADLQKGAAP